MNTKRLSSIFVRAVIVLFGFMVLAFLIRFPLTEGRAANLDLFDIYFDPFILYGYTVSIAFFVALYQAFKLIGYFDQNKVFSSNSVKALKNIKYCAIVISISIVLVGLYIILFHHKEDDPAGFIAVCIVSTIISIVVAIVTAIFEKRLLNVVEQKVNNDLTE